MDAKQLSEQLVDYVYGELSAEQAAAFERSLAENPEVQRELETMQQTRSTVGELEQFDPPPALTQRLLAQATALAPRQAEPTLLDRIQAGLRLLVNQPAVSAAATVVVVLGLSLYVYRLGAPTEEPAPAGIVAHPQHEDLIVLGTRSSAPAAATKAQSEEPADRAPASDEVTEKTEMKVRADVAKGRGKLRRTRKPKSGGLGTDDGQAGSSLADDTRSTRKQPPRRRAKAASAPKPRPTSPIKSPPLSYDRFARGRKADLEGVGNAAPAQPITTPPRDESDVALEAKRRVAAKPFPDTPKGVASAGPPTTAPPATGRRSSARVYEPVSSAAQAGREVEDQQPPKKKARREPARSWLDRGSAAVKARDCKSALAYFDRAVRADIRVAAQVERRLGPCTTQLQRSTKAYPLLAQQVTRARAHRIKREKAAAQRKAPARAPAETENKR